MLRAVCVVSALGCMSLGGCGKAAFKVVPVSGKVTLDGKGLPNLNVSFAPQPTQETQEPGMGSSARTNDEGVYELKLVDGSKLGAVVGKHNVTISRVEPESSGSDTPPPRPKDPVLDPVFAKLLTDPKKVEVPAGGTKDLNIELK
jgi:hypothetical protein